MVLVISKKLGNILMKFILLKNDYTAFLLVCKGTYLIASSFYSSCINLYIILWNYVSYNFSFINPKNWFLRIEWYSIFSTFVEHFPKMTYVTIFVLWKYCYLDVSLKFSPLYPRKKDFMALWKVSLTLSKPKGILKYSKVTQGVVKVVLYWLSSSTTTLLYLEKPYNIDIIPNLLILCIKCPC